MAPTPPNELATRLDRYLAGNDRALAVVRVPTEAEEQKRGRLSCGLLAVRLKTRDQSGTD